MTFPNDYQGVQRSLTFGRWVEPNTDLGKQFALLAQTMLANQQVPGVADKKKFIEFFSVVPGKAVVAKKSVG
jgi:hypothetical protein